MYIYIFIYIDIYRYIYVNMFTSASTVSPSRPSYFPSVDPPSRVAVEEAETAFSV